MCNCGCNTCKVKIRGPLLTESKVKSLLSENLSYHIDNNISLMENVFRIGSDAHLSMIKEAKKLYSRGVLDLCEEDKGLMKTHIGEFDLYENEIVPLDLPMMNLEEGDEEQEELLNRIKDILATMLQGDIDREDDLEDLDVSVDDLNIALTGKTPVDLNLRQKYLGRLGEAKKKKKKKEKKDPPIGKPKRGGSKAYYVYVRDPKTKKVKKVSFGSGGLRAKIRNPKARNAFAKRHRCKEKTDRTKPGYWSCRLPRYASQLGLGANMNTFW